MVVVDRALERRHREGNPIHVAMVGAGFRERRRSRRNAREKVRPQTLMLLHKSIMRV
jgi:hypothetical protein